MTKQDKDNKDKLRVYEYAKSLNMSSKEIITILKRINIPVNNHMSVMENDTVDRVEQFFRDIKANAAAKRANSENGASMKSQVAHTTAAENAKTQPSNAVQTGAPAKKPENASQQQPRNPQQQSASGNAPRRDGQQEQRHQGGGRDQRDARDGGRPRDPNQQRDGQRPRDPNQQRDGQRPRDPNQQRDGGRPGGPNQQRDGQRPRDPNQRDSRYQGGQNRDQRPQGDRPPFRQGDRPQSAGGSAGGAAQGDRPFNRPSGDRPNRPDRPSGDRQGAAAGGRPPFNRDNRPNRPQSSTSGQPAQRSFSQEGPRRNNDSQAAAPGRGGNGFNRQQAAPKNDFRNGKPAETDGEFGSAGKGNSAKKTKPNQKRFDDNKASNKGSFKSGNRNQRGRNQQQDNVKKEKIDNTPKKVIVRGNMTVGEVAKLLHKDASEVIKKLLFLGIMASINQELDLDAIQLIASEYNVEVELKIAVDEDNFELVEETDEDADLIERPPVVTIMGHVDHGKTTLLDAIRSTNVTSGEAGGITQHIGAYQVEIKSKKITFLDTPGHEAFTTMRARGAKVTDITILVVAADDGVMPQTVEAINHAKAAGVPIIVAVNKIDKPAANPDKIKQELTEHALVPEEWGGDTIFVNLSAKQRIGLDELLEMILLVAEVESFKANPDKRARGTVIEAELDKGRGPVARVLVQNGTLKVGDAFIAGVCFGRVRAMVNDKGRRLKEAGPSTPVEITGLTEVPLAGDPFIVFEDERKARAIADRRSITLRQSELGANTRVTLDDLYKHIKDGEIKDLNVIIKADVQGSVEALKGSLEKIEVEGVRVKILHTGAGAITESDIILASASNAIIIGFNVRPEAAARQTADQEKVDIRLHSVIYKVIEEIESAMKGMLDPIFKEAVIGHAEVRNTFKISKVGTIAGCMVIDGKITRSAKARLVRGGIVVFEGEIDSLKRFKDDAKEVSQGYECGITLDRYNDLKEGDVIEAFVMEKVER